MRGRRTHTIGTALAATLTVLGAGLAGCSGAGGPDAGGDGETGDSPAASRAEPGKYETLPEPCKAVGLDTLSELLPVVESESAEETTASGTPRAYEGERSVTYDADRRVGCRWKSSTSVGSRHLHIDFERVVSYDSEVSDEDKAERLYAEKARAADIPDATPTPPETPDPSGGRDDTPSATPSTTPPAGADTAGADPRQTIARRAHALGGTDAEPDGPHTATEDGGRDAEADTEAGGEIHNEAHNKAHNKARDRADERTDDDRDDGTAGESPATPSPPESSLAPRTLDGIGDAAFIDDVLDTTDSGVHRDITLVFRTSNVLVTVEYSQWMSDKRHIPASAELQEKAESLAKKLTSAFED